MFDGQPKRTIIYAARDGSEPLQEWLDAMRDKQGRVVILKRLDKLRRGSPGKWREVGGVYELKIDFGPGYRVYCNFHGLELVILLAGGDKGTQDADIDYAKQLWRDYKERFMA